MTEPLPARCAVRYARILRARRAARRRADPGRDRRDAGRPGPPRRRVLRGPEQLLAQGLPAVARRGSTRATACSSAPGTAAASTCGPGPRSCRRRPSRSRPSRSASARRLGRDRPDRQPRPRRAPRAPGRCRSRRSPSSTGSSGPRSRAGTLLVVGVTELPGRHDPRLSAVHGLAAGRVRRRPAALELTSRCRPGSRPPARPRLRRPLALAFVAGAVGLPRRVAGSMAAERRSRSPPGSSGSRRSSCSPRPAGPTAPRCSPGSWSWRPSRSVR